MYNAELKQRFIRESYTSINMVHTVEVIFSAIEDYETLRGADICTMSKEEVLPVIEELVGSREQSHHSRLYVLKKYVSWCIEQGVPNACDGVLQIQEIGVSKLKRQTVSNPLHLQRFLDCIFEKDDKETIDCVYRAYFWLGYIGVPEDDVIQILDTDVDLIDRVVFYNNKEYPIDSQAFSSIKVCATLKSFNFEHPNGGMRSRDRYTAHNLLRGYTSIGSLNKFRTVTAKRQKEQRFRTQANITDTSLDLQLSYNRVWLSGLFYRMYEGERAGIPVDFMSTALEFMNGRTYRLEKSGNLLSSKQRQLAKSYMTDYERWKSAYQI